MVADIERPAFSKSLDQPLIIDKKFLFANVRNGKISLQHEMQNHFHLNPKLTYVTLGCTISIFDISITYFTGECYIRI